MSVEVRRVGMTFRYDVRKQLRPHPHRAARRRHAEIKRLVEQTYPHLRVADIREEALTEYVSPKFDAKGRPLRTPNRPTRLYRSRVTYTIETYSVEPALPHVNYRAEADADGVLRLTQEMVEWRRP